MKIFLKALWDKPERLVFFAAIIAVILIVIEIRDRGNEIKIQAKNTDAQIEAVGIQSKIDTTQVFSKAVEQLGSKQEIIQLGAIHSLERLAEDSEEYYWTIMQVLTLFCKEYDNDDRITKIPSRYIQEILNVFKRRKYHYGIGEEKERIFDLSSTGLRNQNLREINLSKANLEGANLEGANFQEANLQGDNLVEASFGMDSLKSARNWTLAYYGNNELLVKLGLPEMHNKLIKESNLKGYDFQGANLQKAMLWYAILQKAKNLTIKQLSKAKTLYGAKLDPELMEQVKEEHPHLLKEPEYMSANR